jgi:hypothetical protein
MEFYSEAGEGRKPRLRPSQTCVVGAGSKAQLEKISTFLYFSLLFSTLFYAWRSLVEQ